MIMRIRPARWQRACRPASWRRSSIARQAGAMSAATASMAGSNSSGCGASTPTRKWTNSSRPEQRVDEASALLAQPHDHVDAGDLVALGHFRHLVQDQMRIGDVDQFVIVFKIEVMMRGHVGVEIGLGAVDADLA